MGRVVSQSFATQKELSAWLKKNHAASTELWVRIYKKGSKRPSVTWEDCVLAALTWGWIDGLKRSLDETSFLQRLTPRRPKSIWSKKNCAHAERLIAEGLMQPPGLAQVEAARADGRWDKAYAGSKEMVFPDDFLRALKRSPTAKATFAALKRSELYAIYHRLHAARRAETRERRLAAAIAALAAGKVPFRS